MSDIRPFTRTMIEQLQQTVYLLINLLLWPVVISLLFGMAHTLYLLGNLCSESLQRRGTAVAVRNLNEPVDGMKRRQGFLEWKRQSTLDASADVWLLLDRTEAELGRRVDTARIWVRLGPALGLAGTLIPLGSALTALAANDLQILSQRLILAFGTTVLGLVAGSIAWIVATTLERWYRMDLAEIRHSLDTTE